MKSKNIIYKIWFKCLLVLFLFLPLITETKYDPQDTSILIGEILKNPFIDQIKWILPVLKLILLSVMISPFVLKSKGEKPVLTYYAIMLIVVGIFQNLGKTDHGTSFILGNFAVQSIVCAFVIFDLIKGKTKIEKNDLNKKELWIIPIMLLSLFMPYAINSNGIVTPSIRNIFINESGVTYCMITPVIIGILILFNNKVYKPTLNIMSFAGFCFGIFNMITWFGLDIQNWWMGILHLPLLIISFYGIRKSRAGL